MKFRAKIVGVVLLCAALGSQALTLGRIRGAALIGKPLDMLVQVELDAGEDASSLCFDAEVFHADTRQDASRVRVAVEAAVQTQLASLRITSATPVDEPVVTVYLRTGCGQKTSRRYVLLADLPSEVAAPVVLPAVPASAPVSVKIEAGAAARSAASAAIASAPAPTAAVLSPTQPRVVARPKKAVSQGVGAPRPEVKVSAASAKSAKIESRTRPGRPAGQPRLKLDPLELLSDRVANLDSFMTFEPSEDALLNLQKMQTLEGDVKALRDSARKSEASLVELRARLQQAETERFPAGVIYGLVTLVLAALAALAWLWYRQRSVHSGSDDWWHAADAPAAQVPPATPGSAEASSAADFQPRARSQPVGAKQPALIKATLPGPRKHAHKLDSESIVELLHQSEFFVLHAQTDRAIALLQKQIEQSDEPNPLVYLDLLKLLYATDLRAEFEHLREDFKLLFTAEVPEFSVFLQGGKTLEYYPDVLSRVTGLWPTAKVIDVLEACIFRDLWGDRGQSFDLAAFGELLLLHAIANEINAQADVSAHEVSHPQILDLDLSFSEMAGLFPQQAPATDIDLPLTMPGDVEPGAKGR